jgi:TrpR family trp operon transcriptional repressor
MKEQYLREFIQVLLSLKTEKNLRSFLEAILTPKELEEIPTRLQIVKLLKKGITQKEISKKLGVGIATVTRGSKELQKGSFKNIN